MNALPICPYCGAQDTLRNVSHEFTGETYPDFMECFSCYEDVKVDAEGTLTEDQETK